MHRYSKVAAVLLALPVSTILVACGGEEDTDQRAALEREALERELELALQPDTTVEPELADVALDAPEATQETAPQPAPRPAPRQATPPPRREEPRPSAPAPQPSPEPARPRFVTMPVPSGTTLSLRVNDALSTRSAASGSTFSATLTEPVLAADGTTLIPAGATVRGRVTEARESGRAGQQAYLKVDFTSIAFDGESYPIQATTVDTEVKLVNRDSNAEKAAKIGGGAAVGAVLGQIIGKNTKSTVAGAAIGAAAGTAVAMGTAEVDAVIPDGGRVTIRLDSPISVTKEVG